jgi:hypothetical protein
VFSRCGKIRGVGSHLCPVQVGTGDPGIDESIGFITYIYILAITSFQ